MNLVVQAIKKLAILCQQNKIRHMARIAIVQRQEIEFFWS